ncbi:protein polybromo-1 [Trichonephila clavata]|uniref:Protein polybromo-1 n=1 Tax=Trichonephila clavata TaxID=2740835 RepID=A0A8X6I9L3_TRICU|nr:protein polybromo-1 [Trichonephila clavata]
MPKRKKISITSEEGSKDGSESSKRRKSKLDPVEVCHELYETIRNHRTEDGHLLCESFIRAPNRRSVADYYDIITTPIDLSKIQQKLKTEAYVDVNQISADMELMVNNAKSYYKKNTPEYIEMPVIYGMCLLMPKQIYYLVMAVKMKINLVKLTMTEAASVVRKRVLMRSCLLLL